MTLPRSPAELAWLTDCVGADAALRLIERHGGTRIYVPREVNQGTPLAIEIGLDPARALSVAFGGEIVRIPLAKYWRAWIYRAQGLAYSEIARRLGCTDNTARLMLQARPSDRQMALPLG